MSLKLYLMSVLVILSQTEMCHSLRILGVFPVYVKSHFIMSGSLMKELARRGHQVDVISHFPLSRSIPNYTDIAIKWAPGVLVGNFTYSRLQSFVGLSAVNNLGKDTEVNCCEILGYPNIQKILKGKKGHYDVVVVELFISHCFLAIGRHLGVPVVGVVTMKLYDWLSGAFGTSLNPSYVPGVFSTHSQRMTFWQRLENTLRMAYVMYGINYWIESELEEVERYLGRKLSSMWDLYDDVSLILVNEHHSLTDIKPATPDIIQVGGLHVMNDDQQLTPDVQRWLDESTNGCVYFSLGSLLQMESFPQEVINVFYAMFTRIAPIRVLMKILDPSLLPPGLPKNVKTAPWLAQVAVLKHENVKLFITHGGLLGTQEAVAYKVPMVGLPVFVDQHTNIQSYVEKKIAVGLDLHELTTDSLTSAVKTVLTDPTYRSNIERTSKLFWDRPLSAMDTAVYWVEYTARNGKVLKSPATKLTWWQLYLLDVYGFILLITLIILYIVKKIVAFLFRYTYSWNKRKNLFQSYQILKKSQ